MNRSIVPAIILASVALAAFWYVVDSTRRDASLLLVNGIVYTFDDAGTVAQAVALRGSRIAAVGSSDDLRTRFAADTVIDLGGKTVIPGLIDGHGHILGEGGFLENLDLVGTTSPGQIAALVRERAANSAGGQWIAGRGWDQNRWEDKEFPDHTLLDEAAPMNPVVLRRVDGHAIWVNAKALEAAGLTAMTKDVEGGKIYRDGSGAPTGVLVDNAMALIDTVLPALSDANVEDRLRLALEECARFGLTEVHDMGADLQTIAAYKRLIDRGECPIRVYAAVGGAGPTWDFYRSHGPETGYGGDMLSVRALKLYIDGALGSRGAALVESYTDDPGNRGLTLMSEAELDTLCLQACAAGFQVCTHAIGDRGNHLVLDAYERALKPLGMNESRNRRWRIEHAQVLLPSDIPRFAALAVLPSMQPTHATSDMPWAESRLGAERIEGSYAWRSVLNTGTIIIGGSDFPVESVNPLWGIYAAMTRSDRTGYPEGGWRPGQKMTREEAVRCFTRWAAYGAFQESSKGTIAPGKWADLTVLSKDIMQVPAAEILKTDCEMTIVGGKIIYRRDNSE